MTWIHRLLGIRVTETDRTRNVHEKQKSKKIKKERKQKEKKNLTGNKSSE